MIEVQQPRRHFTDVRQRLNGAFVPLKMLPPRIGSRIEETDQPTRARAHRAEVRALVPIAVKTGEARFSAVVCPPCFRLST